MAWIGTPNFRAGTHTVVVAVTLTILACGYDGTPGPTFAGQYDSVAPDTLFAYINTLHFDSRHWAGDEQRLMVGTCPKACTHGPLVRIEPEEKAHKNSPDSLEHGPGRIIARMINYDSLEYPKYNLAAYDTVYWVVRGVVPVNDSVARGVSLYVSTKALRGARRAPPVKYDSTGIVERHSYAYPKEALARWVWSDSDETKWGGCQSGGCCK
jgi:hypothetical protein